MTNIFKGIDSQGIERDYLTPRCNRAKLDTGPLCNYKCEFCYYKDRLSERTAFDIVKERADYLKQYGITQADLSGGESSISPDWFKILDYCSANFKKVSCLSHGGKFADLEFLKKSKEHGLSEILFSLHGATAEVHDAITERKESFTKILQGIANAKQLGIEVRTNATIYHRNYHQLEYEYADLINKIKPAQVNFITLNYWGDKDVINSPNIAYAAMTDAIKRCINRLDKDIEINVRYVPYCYMKGYEQYVVGVFQHIYDLKDWNREIYSGSLDVSKSYTEQQKVDLAHEACAIHRENFYTKPAKCASCKHLYICDGIENEIATTPVHPEAGDKIKQVMFYR